MSIVTTSVALTAHAAPGDSWRLVSILRALVASVFLAALRTLALLPVRDLVMSVDRTLVRSLLTRIRRMPLTEAWMAYCRTRQPDDAWTIIRNRWAPSPTADGRADTPRGARVLGIHDNLTSPSLAFAESPAKRQCPDTDEKRVIDQRHGARDAHSDPGGRRAG